MEKAYAYVKDKEKKKETIEVIAKKKKVKKVMMNMVVGEEKNLEREEPVI